MAPASSVTLISSPGLARAARALLFAGGLALAVWLVRAAGAARVLEVLRGAGGWLPVVVVLEVAFVSSDLIAARLLLGSAARAVDVTTWVRAMALAYASTNLLPTGRAAGEAARAATLAGAVGTAGAAGACTRLQACVLLANTIVSTIAAGLIAPHGGLARPLAGALLLNALGCAILGTALFALLHDGRFSAWLRRRFPRFAQTEALSTYAAPTKRVILVAQASCVLGCCAQTAQYAVVMYAIGGALSPMAGITAQGIHLVGAAVGDLVPGQLGATEGAYRAFASTLGFGAEAARAVSVPLLVRVAQLSLAVACLLVTASLKRQVPTPAVGR
jgi:hypothetical protein